MKSFLAPIIDPLFKGKASKKYVLTVFIFFFLLGPIIEHGYKWYEAFNKEKPSPPIIGKTREEKKTLVPKEDDLDSSFYCISHFPVEEYSTETELKFLEKDGNYYRPTGAGDSWEGTLWLEKILETKFSSIYIEYEIVEKKLTDNPPSIIIGFSKNDEDNVRKDIVKVWAPEFSERDGDKFLQIMGFASLNNLSDEKIKRQKARELPDPVKKGQNDSLKIESMGIEGNEMSVKLTYNYTSDRTGLSVPFVNSTQVKFPFSDLENSSELLDLSIGTYFGHKFKVASLEVCYSN